MSGGLWCVPLHARVRPRRRADRPCLPGFVSMPAGVVAEDGFGHREHKRSADTNGARTQTKRAWGHEEGTSPERGLSLNLACVV